MNCGSFKGSFRATNDQFRCHKQVGICIPCIPPREMTRLVIAGLFIVYMSDRVEYEVYKYRRVTSSTASLTASVCVESATLVP